MGFQYLISKFNVYVSGHTCTICMQEQEAKRTSDPMDLELRRW